MNSEFFKREDREVEVRIIKIACYKRTKIRQVLKQYDCFLSCLFWNISFPFSLFLKCQLIDGRTRKSI